MLHARAEDLETFLFRAPLQNIDVDIAHAPAFHLQPARFVKIDRIGSDQRRAVIVDDKFLARTDDPEPRSKRKARPI